MINLLTLGTKTSGFGVDRGSSTHKGVDIVLTSPNIPAVMGGTVETAGYSNTAGNWVVIKQEDGTTAKYMHMATTPYVSSGDTVKEGQILGVQGNTGNSRGTHLHFQVEKDGSPINAEWYLAKGLPGTVSDQTVEVSSDSYIKTAAMGIVGKVIYFVVIILVVILAVYLFMKAFDIKIM